MAQATSRMTLWERVQMQIWNRPWLIVVAMAITIAASTLLFGA